MEDKRVRIDDRRTGFVSPELPFMMDNGISVIRERRYLPDRRLSSINVEWIEDRVKGKTDA
jgi:hypothetical protein